ncbi:alpha-amylase family glycosyl hydrolase [Flavihumibacter rivuli]|uniref:alpha-amylase family glycosyl hydrolase n=1 Tax=Flavihumibacter rivuli TaxID=2838156 RepID=UPI001BDE9F7D|nr:alpha-amylase family glycosyl hydrolase [Flavihumibacter rivuli]ULQ55291.1 alpha-amylase family glycosyl hydrolase [Flavihumibacter rivuli]
MRKLGLLLFACLLFLLGQAQLITVSPAFPTESDEITIVFDASKGNKGLFNFGGDVYIHTGVITDRSTGPGDWKYVKQNWNTNNPNDRLRSLGNNKYEYKISGVRAYYGVPAGEAIRKIAFVFRSYNPGGAALEGKCSDLSVDQGNMYWTIYPAGANAIRFTSPESEPRFNPYVLPITASVGSNIALSAVSSKSAALALKLNGTELQASANATSIQANAAIAAPGEQVFVANANDGSTIAGDTFKIFIAPSNTVLPLPAGVKEGINYEQGDTSAILVLYAPNKDRVNLLGDFNDWRESASFQMNKTPDGKHYWFRLTGLAPGVEYGFQYLVNGDLRIGDPYTEKVLDPFNDQFIPASTYPNLKPYPAGKTTGIVSVLQTRQEAYNWQVNSFQRPDKRSLIIYEVLLRDFIEKHDWKTMKDSIGYFKSLGVNAIHVMPFNEFEGNLSWGYNPSYYFAPDKYYGNKNSLKAFVDECHKNGIAVIMDMVLNHSFGQSPMVQLYWDKNLNRPTAESPWYNPIAKHAFNVGYDMNHESADTKRFFSRVVEFWLQEYKLDGFRFDLSKGFTQNNTCDINGNNCNVDNWSAYDASRVRIWKAYYDTLQLKSNGSYVILEHLGVNQEEKELSDYGMMLWGNMNYNFTEAAKGAVGNSNFQWALHTLRGWNQPHLISYMESHDEERSMVKCENEGLSAAGYNIRDEATALKRNEMAAAFLLGMPGPKLIWQFGELGYDYSINYCSNGTVNNDCRTDAKPIRWDYYTQPNRIRVREVYKTMLGLRNHPFYKALFMSDRVTPDLSGAVKILKLSTDTSNLLIIGNFGLGSTSAAVTFQHSGTWFELLTGNTISATGAQQTIGLNAGEYRVYVDRNMNTSPPTPVIDLNNTTDIQLQVIPNPLVANSQLKFAIPESGQVVMRLFDMSGRLLEERGLGFRAKGIHNASLGAATISRLKQGTYLLQLQVNGHRKVLKLLVP